MMVQMVNGDVCSGHPWTCHVFLFFGKLSDSLPALLSALPSCGILSFLRKLQVFFFFFLRFKKNLYLAAPGLSCGMWNL